MSCVDLNNQFMSYCQTRAQHSQSTWSQQSQIIKMSNNALCDIKQLEEKLNYLQEQQRLRHSKIHTNKQQLSQKLTNVHNSIKLCENLVKKISNLPIDFKISNKKFGEDFRTSIIAGLQLKMLSIGLRFKKLYKAIMEPQTKKNSDNDRTETSTDSRDLGRSHFLEQTEQEIMEEAAVNQYKQIEKSINHISEMYKETMSVVKMHELLIDSISGSIDETQFNVEEGRKNLTEAHHRQTKNRKFIIKIFGVLYSTVTIYIVFLS